MFLKQLYARNFRNFDEITVHFVDGVNEVVGDNAQGKTSLLEALFLCMTASSFRSQHLKDLIRHTQKGFFVEASFEKCGVDHQVGISYDGEKRRVFLNGSPCETPTVLLGLMPGVASTPDDIAVVKGQPSLRRRYLDLMVAQIDPVFVHHLSRFMRALKQRNVLLKQKQIGSIACWEEELARSSAYISVQRKKAVEFVGAKAAGFFAAFSSEKLPLVLNYVSSVRPIDDLEELRKHFMQEFDRKRNQEVHLGVTLVGPHRDDVQILIGEKPAREFASVGQSALTACAMRLAEWHYLERETRSRPLMIVDDFGAALDSTRKKLLFKELGTLGQLFLSSHSSLQTNSSANTLTIHEGKLLVV
jgi:DNA replication and repair protein RecF